MPIAMYKAMKETQYNVRIDKPACYHAFHYSLAAHLLENGYDIRTIEELPGTRMSAPRRSAPVPTSGILTKTGEQQILRIFSAEKCRRWKGIYRNLIVAPSAVHLIGGRNDHCVLELRRGVPQ